MKITFIKPNPRRDDWRVALDGRNIGSVWRCGADYRASVSATETAPTLERAFKAARRQVRLALKGR